MDRLWTPWRYAYVTKAEPASDCVFCDKGQPGFDEEKLVVFRGERNFILLNLYPYNNGHIMIAPYEHVPTFEEAAEETAVEMIRLARRCHEILRRVYHPKGINMGMNVGECAGAGVASHIHMHLLPRWPGDSGFMTTVSETRVIPEDLEATYRKLAPEFQDLRL